MFKSINFYLAFTFSLLSLFCNAQAGITLSSYTYCSGDAGVATANSGSLSSPSFTWSASSGAVNILSPNANQTILLFNTAGNFTISLGVTSGTLILYATQTVVVKPIPNITVIPSSSYVCVGFTSTLAVSGALSYSVFGTSFLGSVSPSVGVGPGNYTVVGSNGGSCTNTAITSIGIAPNLFFNVSASKSLVCKDFEPSALSVSGSATYYWTPYDPAHMTFSVGANTSVTPSVNTTYTVEGLTASCSGIAFVTVNVQECNGIKELHENKFKLFPSPFQDQLTIYSTVAVVTEITVIDLFGKVVADERNDFHNESGYNLNLEHLVTGIYFLKINSQNEISKTFRIIKE